MSEIGRPKITERVSEQAIVNAYKRFGSVRDAGKALGISKDTVRKYLALAGVELKPRGGAWRRGQTIAGTHRGAFVKWLREHPHVELPNNVKEIAELTGVSEAAIRAYLYRRRKRIKERLALAPDLRRLQVVLQDTRGEQIPTHTISRYSYHIGRVTCKVTVSGLTHSGYRFTAKIPDVERYVEILQKST